MARSVPEFRPDTRWSARVLDTPPDAVNVALQRLTRLGLLKWCRRRSGRPVPPSKPLKRPRGGRPVVKWQMIARDPERLAAFYSELFGWRIDAANALHYLEVDTGSKRGIGGGIWRARSAAR